MFSVFSNNFVNESMLSGFSIARFEDISVRNSTSEYLIKGLATYTSNHVWYGKCIGHHRKEERIHVAEMLMSWPLGLRGGGRGGGVGGVGRGGGGVGRGGGGVGRGGGGSAAQYS